MLIFTQSKTSQSAVLGVTSNKKDNVFETNSRLKVKHVPFFLAQLVSKSIFLVQL